MKQRKGVFEVMRVKGSAAIAQVSDHLLKSPAFHDFVVRGVENLYRGKEKLNGAVGQALKTMNVPTRTEFKRAVARIDALERERAGSTRSARKGTARARRRPASSRRKKTTRAAGGA